jgi:glycosyltransferase involved in cell wall biosynthesis
VTLTPDSWLATAAFAALALLFVAIAGSKLASQRWAHPLPSLDALPPDAAAAEARVSIVVPARDEADTIEASVRQLLAQRGVAIEVIVVSDRSVDATPSIVARLAAEDPRVRLVEVGTLPERWLGKTHALHVGSQAATGDWLLFTDADCLLRPDVVARALRVAARERVDQVALSPAPIAATVGGYAWHYVFLAGLADWFARANRDLPGGYIGFGAFNLVRAATHRAFGGHEPLRLTVLDDVRLGLLVRRAGGRCRAFLGGEDVRCHWGRTLGEGIRLTEKNYFAAAHYRGGVVCALIVVIALLWVGVGAALASGTVLGLVAGFSGGLLALPALVFSRRLRWPIAAALLAPFVHSIAAYAIVRSAVLTWRRGGVRWRDTFYPLAELRAGDLK